MTIGSSISGASSTNLIPCLAAVAKMEYTSLCNMGSSTDAIDALEKAVLSSSVFSTDGVGVSGSGSGSWGSGFVSSEYWKVSLVSGSKDGFSSKYCSFSVWYSSRGFFVSPCRGAGTGGILVFSDSV